MFYHFTFWYLCRLDPPGTRCWNKVTNLTTLLGGLTSVKAERFGQGELSQHTAELTVSATSAGTSETKIAP